MGPPLNRKSRQKNVDVFLFTSNYSLPSEVTPNKAPLKSSTVFKAKKKVLQHFIGLLERYSGVAEPPEATP